MVLAKHALTICIVVCSPVLFRVLCNNLFVLVAYFFLNSGVYFVDVCPKNYLCTLQNIHMNLMRVLVLDGNMRTNQSMTGAP